MSETEVTTESQVVDDEPLDAFADDFFGQKKPAVSETKEAVEQEAPDDKGEATEAQKPDDTDDLNEEYVEPVPKKKTAQDRINEVVKEREDAKREAASQIEALRKEFEDYKKGTAVVEPPKGEPTPFDVKEDGDPIYPLGEFDPQYIRDLTRFTLQEERTKANAQTEQENRTRAAQAEGAQLQASWNAKLETAQVEYPDLNEKGQALLNGFTDLSVEYSGYLSQVLMSMNKGPDVLYYLSNHPDEARTIVNSGAQKATLALGRIEAKFLDADAEKQLAKPKVSKAPPPPTERARGNNGAFIAVAGDTDNLEDFEQAFFKKK